MEKHTVNITVSAEGVKSKSTKLDVYKFKPIDYYNERADFLEDNKVKSKEGEKREIRLIYQNVYDEIINTDVNSLDYYIELYEKSSVIQNKVKGSDFKKMLDDSNLKYGIYGDKNGNFRRKEQAALILFDTTNNEIRLERQDDKENTYNMSKLNDGIKSPIDKKIIWCPGSILDANEDVIIIGTIHTHPINYIGEKWIGHVETNPDKQKPDIKMASNWNVPFFQLYPLTINEVDVIIPGKKNIDNITTTKNLIKEKFDFTQKTLEIYREI